MADQDFQIRVVTTSDTSGLIQTKEQIDKLAAQMKAANQSAFELGQALRVIGGGAVITGGYKLIQTILESAKEIEKISTELNKQGGQIVVNAQKFSEESKFAKTTADVIKIGESALKGVETAHKNLLDISNKELTTWQKVADIWAAGFRDKGPIKQALELQQAQAQQNYEMERNNAIHEISAAQRTKDDLATKSYGEKVEYLTDKIKEQQDIQKRVGVENIEDYLKAGKEAENYSKILVGINNERKNEISQGGERTKQILKNEELAREARKYGRQHEAEAFDIGTRLLKESSTTQELAEYKRLSGQEEAEARTRKNQEALDRELERQRTIPSANYKPNEQIQRETRERIDTEANERARRGKVQEQQQPQPQAQPEAKPSPAPTPSPDVVTAIERLGEKFDRYWS